MSSSKKLGNKNLKQSIYYQKARKFKFIRKGQGTTIEEHHRQWILRLYYWLKVHSPISYRKAEETVADFACCSRRKKLWKMVNQSHLKTFE